MTDRKTKELERFHAVCDPLVRLVDCLPDMRTDAASMISDGPDRINIELVLSTERGAVPVSRRAPTSGPREALENRLDMRGGLGAGRRRRGTSRVRDPRPIAARRQKPPRSAGSPVPEALGRRPQGSWRRQRRLPPVRSGRCRRGRGDSAGAGCAGGCPADQCGCAGLVALQKTTHLRQPEIVRKSRPSGEMEDRALSRPSGPSARQRAAWRDSRLPPSPLLTADSRA